MSTISVSNITTANGSEPLTLATGNTTGGSRIIVRTDGTMNVMVSSTVSALGVNTSGGVIANIVSVTTNLNAVKYQGNTVLVRETVYTANGTHTKVGNLVSMMVYCVGAGGGGGGATGAATATGAFGAAGGAGGDAAIKVLLNSEVGATSNVVAGIGGAGGTTSTVAGGTGSNSSFAMANGLLVIGRGGGGATGATPGVSSTGVNGDLNLSGQNGSRGLGNGVALAVSLSGQGGASALGFGGGGGPVRSNAAGLAGDRYGGGGGGAAQGNTATSLAGGAGANGVVWVVEYYNGV